MRINEKYFKLMYMKRTSISLMAAMIGFAALSFTSCKENPYYPAPGDNNAALNGNPQFITITKWWYSGDEGLNVPAGAISVKEAIEIGKTLPSGAVTEQLYYIKGLVKSDVTEGSYNNTPQYTFNMVSDSTDATSNFIAYQVSSTLPDMSKLKGCWVVVYSKLQNYNGTIEAQRGSITSRTQPIIKTQGNGTLDNPYTVADLLALDRVSTQKVYVRGYIRGVTTVAETGTITNEAEELHFAPMDEQGFANNINILLADNTTDTQASSLIVAKLPGRGTDIRKALQLGVPEYADRLGQEVIICGQLDKYAGLNSVEEIIYAKINGVEYTN